MTILEEIVQDEGDVPKKDAFKARAATPTSVRSMSSMRAVHYTQIGMDHSEAFHLPVDDSWIVQRKEASVRLTYNVSLKGYKSCR